MIESLPQKPLIVFMTGHNSKKTATKGHALAAVHYLTKPFSFKDFKEAMTRVMNRIEGMPNADKSLGDYEMFGRGGGQVRIMFGDIRYIEAKGNDVIFHLANQIAVTVREALKDVSAKLPEAYFIQVHKSFIISTWHLFRLRAKSVLLYGTDKEVPVGRTYRKELRTRFPDDPSRK